MTSNESTAIIMSIIGFESMPGIAVLPTCWISNISLLGKAS